MAGRWRSSLNRSAQRPLPGGEFGLPEEGFWPVAADCQPPSCVTDEKCVINSHSPSIGRSSPRHSDALSSGYRMITRGVRYSTTAGAPKSLLATLSAKLRTCCLISLLSSVSA